MSFGHHFDFDAIYAHIQAEVAHFAAQHPLPDVTLPTVDAVEPITVEAVQNHVAQIAQSAGFTLPPSDAFDFGGVEPHVVEQHGDGWSTVTKTWNHDTSSHTGAGSSSWSTSSSSADAATNPGPTKSA